MAEQVLKFSIRTDGAQARAEAEATARAIVAAVRGAVSTASGAAGRAAQVSGASGGSVGGDVRGALAAARLEQAQQRVAIGAQNVAAAQTRAEAATIRAANSYQKATASAEKFAGGQANLNQILGRVGGSLRNLGLGLTSLGASLSISLTAPLLALGAASLKSAKDIDASVNTLKAFTGSAEAAEKRLAQLIATSRKTPGLTTALAAQLDAQLRVARVTEETIDRILPAVGRLNAVKPIDDPDRFVQNLVQLVTQNFERQDLKELVGRSPLAGQVITEVFNVDSPVNAAAIRKAAQRMGIRTVDDFFAAFADAAARNKGLQNVTESLGTRFDKLRDRLMLALRPLGLALADSLTSIADSALPVVERLGEAFGALPRPIQTAVVAVGAFAAVLGPTMFIAGQFATGIGGLISAFGRLNALGLLPTIQGFRLLQGVMAGTTSLAAGQVATTAALVAGWAGLVGAIAAAAVAGLAITRVIDGYLESLKAAHPWVVRVGRATLEAFNPLYALLKGFGLVGPETKKVADAQAAAVPPIKGFTAAIEEETLTLRELKRALEEAEIATRSRVAAAQRSYNEERITIQEATRVQIDALLEGQRAQLAVIDEGIRESAERLKALQESAPQGLGPHGGVATGKEAQAERDRLERLRLDRLRLIAETENQVADLQSQQRIKERQLEKERAEEVFALLQRGHSRRLELFDLQARQYIERQKALAQAEIITYAEAQKRIAAEQARGFERRRELLEKELEAAKGNADKEAEILHQLAVLKEQAALFVQEASGAASAAAGADLDRMIQKFDALAERLDRMREAYGDAPFSTENVDLSPTPQGEGPVVTEDMGVPPGLDPFARLKELWTGFKIHALDAADAVRESVASMAETVGEAIASMVDATRQGIVAWLLYGESLGKALKTALAHSMAAVAADALMQSLKHAAYAIGSWAFGDARGAVLHAKAAAAFGALALVAGVAAKGLAGNAGLNRGGVSAGSVAAQDAQPRNQQFSYGGGSPATPASEEQSGGSRRGRGVMGGALAPVLDRIDRTLSRLEGIPAGQVVSMGAGDARAAIGVAVLQHSGSDDSFNDGLARNMRVA